jgi:hypothetical protein
VNGVGIDIGTALRTLRWFNACLCAQRTLHLAETLHQQIQTNQRTSNP